MKHTIFKHLLFIGLLTIVSNPLFASTSTKNTVDNTPEKITLQLQWKDQFEFAGFYAAKEKGFYKESGLDVDFKAFESGLDIIDEVLEGRAEYGLVYSSVISRYLEGDPLVFVANFFKHSPLVVVTQKEFQHPSDLFGKRIMGTTNELSESTLIMMFKKFDMSAKDFTTIPPSFTLDDFISKKIDAMAVFTTNETYHLDEAGVAYNVMNPAAYGIPFYDLNLFTTQKELKNHPERVANFKAASIKGWKYALEHKEEIIQLILKKYNTQNKSYEALTYEGTQIEHIMLPSLYPIGSIDHQRVELMAENFIEIDLVNKDTVIDLKNFIYREPQKDLKLTHEEMQYLNKKHEITYCVDPAWMPLSQIKDDTHIGMDSDYIEYLSSKLNIPFRLIPTQTWIEAMDKAEKGACEILTLVVQTPKRKQYFTFTQTLFSTPLVLATKVDKNFINDISKMKNKPIGMVKGYAYKDKLTFQYPLLNFVEVNTIADGLRQVAEGEIYGLVGNLTTIGYMIQQNYIGTLKVSSKLNIDLNLGYAVQKENTLLLSILNKAIHTLDERTKESIMNRWSNVKYSESIDYPFMNKILLGLLIVFFIIWYRYRMIKIDNKHLQELSTKDALSKLYNRRYIDKLIQEKQITSLIEKHFCLILVDIDNFKKVNDTYGHEHGDKTIIKFSELLRKNVRTEDTVSRWGGEEFLIFCPHTNIHEATYLAERIRSAVQNTSFNTSWQITASLGVSQYSNAGGVKESYITKIDRALAKAKQTGKNKVVVES